MSAPDSPSRSLRTAVGPRLARLLGNQSAADAPRLRPAPSGVLTAEETQSESTSSVTRNRAPAATPSAVSPADVTPPPRNTAADGARADNASPPAAPALRRPRSRLPVDSVDAVTESVVSPPAKQAPVPRASVNDQSPEASSARSDESYVPSPTPMTVRGPMQETRVDVPAVRDEPQPQPGTDVPASVAVPVPVPSIKREMSPLRTVVRTVRDTTERPIYASAQETAPLPPVEETPAIAPLSRRAIEPERPLLPGQEVSVPMPVPEQVTTAIAPDRDTPDPVSRVVARQTTAAQPVAPEMPKKQATRRRPMASVRIEIGEVNITMRSPVPKPTRKPLTVARRAPRGHTIPLAGFGED